MPTVQPVLEIYSDILWLLGILMMVQYAYKLLYTYSGAGYRGTSQSDGDTITGSASNY